MPHPSWRNNGWLKRNPWFEAELLPVLRAEVARFIYTASGSAEAAVPSLPGEVDVPMVHP